MVFAFDPHGARDGPEGNEDRGFFAELFYNLLHALDPGTIGGDEGTWRVPAHDAGAHAGRPVHRQRADRRAGQRHRLQAGRPAARPLDRARGGAHRHPRLVGVDLHDHLRADAGQREPQGPGDRDPRRPGQGRHGGGAQGQGARAPRHQDHLPLRLADGPRRPAAQQPRHRPLGDPAGARLRRPRLRGHQDPARADPRRRRGAADRRRDPGPEQPRGRRAGRQGPDHAARHPRDGGQAGRADLAPVRCGGRLHRAVRLLRRRVLLLRGPRPGRVDVRRGAAGVRGGVRGRHRRRCDLEAEPAARTPSSPPSRPSSSSSRTTPRSRASRGR